MNILIYEHLSSGAFHDKTLDVEVMCEGYGMLNSLTSDFKIQGHKVTILLDSRLAEPPLPTKADKVIVVNDRHQSALKKAISEADAALMIAPESENTLKSVVSLVEDSSANSLNCSSETIEVLANKDLVYNRLKKLGIAMPRTIIFDSKDRINEIKKTIKKEFRFPIIIKPAVGESCCRITKAKKEDELEVFIKKAANSSQKTKILVQEFVEGINASVSLISNGTDCYPISLNYQDVLLESSINSSKYIGGITPLENPMKMQAFETAQNAVKAFDGVRGYLGVDIILTSEKVFFLEVNPRPTTSIVGIRKIINENIAGLILGACLEKKLPNYIDIKKVAFFSKEKTFLKNHSDFLKTLKIKEIISPPFMIDKNAFQFALIQTDGNTLEEAHLKFSKVQKQL